MSGECHTKDPNLICNIMCDTRIYSQSIKMSSYRQQTKLREGNVFTGVCDSVYRGGGAWSGGCLVPV